MQIISMETSVVFPETPTNPHTILPCSICDNLALYNNYVRTVYIYEKASKDVATKLKAALAKVLVFFYPMAGRVQPAAQGKFGYEIDCNDKGVVWIDAQVDGTIDAFHLTSNSNTFVIDSKLLVPKPDFSMQIKEQPVVYIQVNKFKCGGFALGMCIRHIVVDGISALNFVTAWTELAQGKKISQLPNFNHHLLSSKGRAKPEACPVEIQLEPPPSPKTLRNRFEFAPESQKMFTFTGEMLKKIKADASAQGSFSTFESLAAHIFRAVIRAKGCEDSEQTRFFTVLDVRKRIKPNMPEGYFGNAVVDTCVAARAGDILDKPLSFTAQLIREGILKMTDEYIKSLWAWCEAQDYLSMQSRTFSGNDVVVGGWHKMPFYDTDFGFGKPVFVGPASFRYNMALPGHVGIGSVNVFISLKKEQMDKLITDTQFTMVG